MSLLDSLLDQNLDDLADMPTFTPFPAGVHLVTMELEPKEVNDKLLIGVNFTYVSPVEMGDPAAEAPKAGDKASTTCQMDNEYGQGTFKMIGAVVAEALGLTPPISNRAIVEQSKGMTVQIVTSIRKGKGDNDGKEFLQLKAISLPA